MIEACSLLIESHQRYVYPVIAPPTPPQLEQDKKAIDESFSRAFALLDQLAADTESLKASEKARTERLDSALADVESVVGEMKSANRRRQDESSRISSEVRNLKDLIPKALEAQKESNDKRLMELNSELKSLKTLMSNRISGSGAANLATSRSLGGPNMFGSQGTSNVNGSPGVVQSTNGTGGSTADAASPSTQPASAVASPDRTQSASPYGRTPGARAAIPAWQMAAAKKDQEPMPEKKGAKATEGGTVAEPGT